MADSEFGELMAGLDASTAAIEKAEAASYAAVEAEPVIAEGNPPDDGGAMLSLEPIEEVAPPKVNPPRETPGDLSDDEMFPSPVEFPDLSLEGEKGEEDFEDEDEAESGVGEERTEEDLSEDEESEPSAGTESFDLDSTMAEIADLKVPEVRKAYARVKAEKIAAEGQIAALRAEAQTAKDEVETIRSTQLDAAVAPEKIPYTEYAPFKDLNSEYGAWRTRSLRKVKNGAVREKLAQDGVEHELRTRAAAIEMLPTDKYDAARQEFENQISHQFGKDQTPAVLNLADEAAEFEIRGLEIRKEFDGAQEERGHEFAATLYKEKVANIDKALTGVFQVDAKEMETNPFSVRSVTNRLLKDSKYGNKILDFAKGDIESIQNVLSGHPPFKPDASLNPADTAEQKKLYVESRAKSEALKDQLPEILAQGLMAMRLLPTFAKDMAGANKGKAPIPTKQRSNPKKKAKTEDQTTPEDARAALDRAFSLLGS